MRQVFLFVLFVLVILLIFIFEHEYRPLETKLDKITVQIKYHDQTIPLTIDQYSTLKEALQEVSLGKDVDYQAINDQIILSHKDVYVVPLKTQRAKVSLNSGSVEELSTINGIGPKTAESIVRYREEFGLFKNIDELMNVKGIGPKKFAKMKEQLCL